MSVTLEPYQEEAIKKAIPVLKKNKIVYLRFWMRKGKTFSSLSIANNYLNGVYGAHVLFVTEKTAMSSIKADYMALQPSFEITVINYESLHKVTSNYHLIVVDEVHKIGKFPKPAIAAEKLKKICAYKPIILLSATPTPESFSQLYHQLWISTFSPLAQWHSFYRFADMFVNKVMKDYKGLMSADYSDCDIKKLEGYIGHLFITVREQDGKQMLPVKHNILYVDMTPKAIAIFKQLQNHKIYRDEYGRVATCNSGAEKDSKLLQVGSGTLIFNEDINGKIFEDGVIIDTTKAEYIRDYFKGKKIAVLYRFNAEGAMLKMFFPNWTDSPEEFNACDDKTFIRHIKSAKAGVNLATADCLVFITPPHSSENFIQGSARLQHIFRTKTPDVFWIMSKHGNEQEIFKTVSQEKHEYTNYHYA